MSFCNSNSEIIFIQCNNKGIEMVILQTFTSFHQYLLLTNIFFLLFSYLAFLFHIKGSDLFDLMEYGLKPVVSQNFILGPELTISEPKNLTPREVYSHC